MSVGYASEGSTDAGETSEMAASGPALAAPAAAALLLEGTRTATAADGEATGAGTLVVWAPEGAASEGSAALAASHAISSALVQVARRGTSGGTLGKRSTEEQQGAEGHKLRLVLREGHGRTPLRSPDTADANLPLLCGPWNEDGQEAGGELVSLFTPRPPMQHSVLRRERERRMGDDTYALPTSTSAPTLG